MAKTAYGMRQYRAKKASAGQPSMANTEWMDDADSALQVIKDRERLNQLQQDFRDTYGDSEPERGTDEYYEYQDMVSEIGALEDSVTWGRDIEDRLRDGISLYDFSGAMELLREDAANNGLSTSTQKKAYDIMMDNAQISSLTQADIDSIRRAARSVGSNTTDGSRTLAAMVTAWRMTH